MDYIQSTYNHNEFILLGLCSGADDAFATAQEDKRVKGLVLLNGYAYKTRKFKLYRFKEFYLPRLFMYKKWKKKIKDLFTDSGSQKPQLETSASSAMSAKERDAVIAMDDDYRYIPPQKQTGLIIDSLTKKGSVYILLTTVASMMITPIKDNLWTCSQSNAVILDYRKTIKKRQTILIYFKKIGIR